MAHWSQISALMVTTAVLTALLCAGCTSPGSPYSYKDVKVSAGPSASPAQPYVGQGTTVSFTLRNTWNKPLAGINWRLVETTGGGSTAVGNGSADVAAFGSIVQSVALTTGVKGTRTFVVEVDHTGTIAEDDETNNTSGTLTVLVADQDIAFSSTTTPVVTWPTMGNQPSSSATPTLAFTLTNTPAAGVAGNSPSVSYTITRNGDPFSYTPAATPVTVSTAGQTVTVTLPATGSAGTFEYTITLTPDPGDDSNTTNNEQVVTVVIPAGA